MNRLPGRNQIMPVYAAGVTILYSWAVIIAIRDSLFNWVLYFNTIEILHLAAYVMAGAFVESLLLIAALIAISLILPQKLFAEKFVLRGTILTITFLGSIMYYYTQTPLGEALMDIYKWGASFAISAITLTLAAEYIPAGGRIVELIADRCLVFLYIYLPISFISVIVVVITNLG